MTTATTQLADWQHPWLGLASFTESDREFFAGRSEEIDELLRLVRRDTLTLLYGVSGLGKTSLVQAGLFPALRAEDCLPVPIRLDYLEGAAPLTAQVLGAISAAAGVARVEAPPLRPDETLWEYFHREGNHFWSPRNDLVTPFLAFDQFEELFTLGRETPECAARSAAFIGELADLVENRPPAVLREDPLRAKAFSFKPARLKVLLSMREDYLAELDRIRVHFRALGQNRLRLLPMGERQARQVIALGAPLLAPGVEDRILKFVAGGNEDDAETIIAPALLSLVLRELNERRLKRGPDAKITPDLFGVEQQNIFEDFYRRTLKDFPVGVRTFIEDKLLTTSGYRDSCALDDALCCSDVTQPILDKLVNSRLLAYEDRHRTRRVELTHDVLIPVIKASRDTRLTRAALAQAEERERRAQEEKQRQERELEVTRKLVEEQKRRAELSEQREKEQKEAAEKLRQAARKLRRRAMVAVGAAAAAMVLLVTAVFMWRAAQNQAREAANQRDDARYNEGLGWMLRAEVAEERSKRYPETLLYAAKAIGFEGFGRPATAEEPVQYLRRDRNPAAFARAQKWVTQRPAYRPVWASALQNLPASGLSLSPTGRWLALAGEDGQVSLWDLVSGQETALRTAGASPVRAVAFDPLEKTLAIATNENIELWGLEKRAQASTHPGGATALAWSPGGELLAAAGPAGSIVLWRGERRSEIASGLTTPAARLAFSPENSVIAAAYPGKGVRLFFPHAGKAANAWLEHKGDANAVAVSPDGLRLAIGGADGSLALWSAADAKELGHVPAELQHRGAVLDLAFREDGRQLASASADETIKLWETSTEIPTNVATLCGAVGAVSRVEYAPGGDLLAGAGVDGAARLWSVAGQLEAQPNLFQYLTEHFYRFNPATQQACWDGGVGFVEVPRQSLLGLWQQEGSGGVAGYLLARRAWAGAARLGADPVALAQALLADAEKAAQENRWHRVDLRLSQLIGVNAIAAAQKLTAARAAAIAQPGHSFKNGEGQRMIWCPPTGPGGFLMGSPESEKGRSDDETQHKVVLTTGFWLGEYEVTQAEWTAVMGSNPSTIWKDSSGPKVPVQNISWFEAVDFCRRLTDRERARGTLPPGFEYALPTEAQWEYACRAGTTTAYSFGDDPAELHKYGNFNDRSGGFDNGFEKADKTQDDGYKYTAPVGSYLANAWGFYDMHGNVWEWCQDALNPDTPYAAAEVTDPMGSVGTHRAYRGGGWQNMAIRCRSANRRATEPSDRIDDLGLRPALVPSRPVPVNGNERGSAR
jgi:formylglycine-generating enzyme required for sulfatase activity